MSVHSPSRHDQLSSIDIKERRVWVRHCCELDVFCTEAGGARPPRKKRSGSGISDLNKRWPARVYNISRGGMKLEGAHPFRVGALFELEADAGSGNEPITVQARVIDRFESDDGIWTIRCEFVEPLDETELRTLLRYGSADRNAPPEPLLARLRGWVARGFGRP